MTYVGYKYILYRLISLHCLMLLLLVEYDYFKEVYISMRKFVIKM